jgi:hypothetical protein
MAQDFGASAPRFTGENLERNLELVETMKPLATPELFGVCGRLRECPRISQPPRPERVAE